MFSDSPKAQRGFTLIELLIAVAIIAILSTIAVVSYGVLIKNARDSKRQGDLRSIQLSLEQYFADQVFYPFSSGATSLNLSTSTSLTSSTGNPSPPPAAKIYINTIPHDPISSNPPYCYLASPSGCDNSNTKCTSYTIYAKLENSAAGNLSCGGNNTYNFSLTLP